MSATLGIGGAVGLPLSGVIYEAFGWQAVFWGSVAMSVLMLVLVLTVVPESTVRTPGRFDWLGAILMSVALTALLLGISKGGEWGWTSQWTLLSFLVAVLVFGLWAPWELRTGQPLVDLRTSVRRPVLFTNIASLLAGFAMFANLLVAIQQLQLPRSSGVGFGLSVTEAGLAMLPGGVLMILMSPVSASITRRFGARTTLVAGLAVTGFGYVVRVLLDGVVIQLMSASRSSRLGIAIVLRGDAGADHAVGADHRDRGGQRAQHRGPLDRHVDVLGDRGRGARRRDVVAGTTFPSEAAVHATSWLAAGAAFLGAAVGMFIPARIAPALAPMPAARPGERPAEVRADAVRRGGRRPRGRGPRPGAEARRQAGAARGRLGAGADRPAGGLGACRQRGALVGGAAGGGGVPRGLLGGGLGSSVRAAAALSGRVPRARRSTSGSPSPGVVSRGGWPVDDALVVLTDAVGRVRGSDPDRRGGPLRARAAAAGSLRPHRPRPEHRDGGVRGRGDQCPAAPVQRHPAGACRARRCRGRRGTDHGVGVRSATCYRVRSSPMSSAGAECVSAPIAR